MVFRPMPKLGGKIAFALDRGFQFNDRTAQRLRNQYHQRGSETEQGRAQQRLRAAPVGREPNSRRDVREDRRPDRNDGSWTPTEKYRCQQHRREINEVGKARFEDGVHRDTKQRGNCQCGENPAERCWKGPRSLEDRAFDEVDPCHISPLTRSKIGPYEYNGQSRVKRASTPSPSVGNGNNQGPPALRSHALCRPLRSGEGRRRWQQPERKPASRSAPPILQDVAPAGLQAAIRRGECRGQKRKAAPTLTTQGSSL